MIFIFSVAAVYIFQLASFALSIPRLLDMYRFYTHLLGIPDVSGTLTDPLDVPLLNVAGRHTDSAVAGDRATCGRDQEAQSGDFVIERSSAGACGHGWR